ncbi:Carbohydrate sulfotransferase 12 [Mactra antiquata]
MVMNQKHDITYCRVNKVASTYTMDLLTRLFKCSEDRLRGYAHEVEELPYSEMRRVVAKSFKFTFVREPYGRLFSTYSNKFYFPKEHWAPIGPLIVKRYRTNPSKDSLTYGHNITFAEMIRFLVDEFEAGRKVDEHLRPMNHRCNPCDYDYDFIGKLETLDADWNYLKQYWLKIKKISEIPEPAPKTGTSAFPDLKHILLTHTVIKDSTISKYKLYLRAWTYYQMTGYIYKYIDMPFNPSSQIKFKDFQTALEVAAERSKPYMTQTKQQKMEAIKQAYGSLPYPLLTRLRKVVDLDCKLFDYDCKPDWIFKMNDQKTDFDYFRGLN